MYYRRKLKIALMMVLVLVLSVSVAWAGGQKEEADDEEVYINGIDPDFPPFGYVDEEGNPAGFDVESVNWIAEEMGFEVKHQPTAWDGIIEALRAGKIDFVASGMSILPEREEVISFTIPYWETDLAVAVREDSDISYEEALSGEH
ncbi:MAG: transporter substrate-binding domain-containing protein, partial [Sediminispirochaetaceae bacterium]